MAASTLAECDPSPERMRAWLSALELGSGFEHSLMRYMSDRDLACHEEDQKIYETGEGALAARFLILTVDASVHAENNPAVERLLESVHALKTGTNTWLIQTKMSPAEIVNSVRRHLAIRDAVYAFTVCDQCSWAGPRVVRKFFELYGTRIQRSDEIAPPVSLERTMMPRSDSERE